MKRRRLTFLVGLMLAISSTAAAQSSSDEVSPRITRLERWLSATAAHRPGAFDEAVREVNSWSKEQLRLIWVDLSTIVSILREPSISLFFVSEPQSRGSSASTRQVTPLATNRSAQVLYTIGELRALRAIARKLSSDDKPGPENDLLKRGAMLHADIEVLAPLEQRPRADPNTPGPGGSTLFMDDGQQLGLLGTVSHWNMGARLLDRVRPVDSTRGVKTAGDPGADDTVRRWYLAACAYMLRIRRIELPLFTRALELFPDDPQLLFLTGSAHEMFAGVRTQAGMQGVRGRRDVTFDVQDASGELRRAEQFYERTLERDPQLLEARIRLGRVMGLRGRHKEAVAQLQQGLSATEPLLQFYASLFLGAEFETLGNGAEARRSYERAAALAPTAQSPLLGLSRVADQSGERAAARDAVARMLKVPSNDVERVDPWWVYEIAPARQVDSLLAELRKRF